MRRVRPFWFIGGPNDGARVAMWEEDKLVVCRPTGGGLLGAVLTPPKVREGVYERVGDLMIWRGWK